MNEGQRKRNEKNGKRITEIQEIAFGHQSPYKTIHLPAMRISAQYIFLGN